MVCVCVLLILAKVGVIGVKNLNFLLLILLSFFFFTMPSSALDQQRRAVEQLRNEAAIKRVAVSQAIEELKRYVQEHEQEDYLLVGFHSQKANPFREKSSCQIL
ncbi:Guanine nucleotide-binding protein subunit gamma-1 [Chamberlinius hualienensis]